MTLWYSGIYTLSSNSSSSTFSPVGGAGVLGIEKNGNDFVSSQNGSQAVARAVSPRVIIDELEQMRNCSDGKMLGLNALMKEVKKLRFANARPCTGKPIIVGGTQKRQDGHRSGSGT